MYVHFIIKHLDSPRRMRLFLLSFDRFASLLCMSSAFHHAASCVRADANNDPAIGVRMMEMGSRK
jgi:hypothetical protein